MGEVVRMRDNCAIFTTADRQELRVVFDPDGVAFFCGSDLAVIAGYDPMGCGVYTASVAPSIVCHDVPVRRCQEYVIFRPGMLMAGISERICSTLCPGLYALSEAEMRPPITWLNAG